MKFQDIHDGNIELQFSDLVFVRDKKSKISKAIRFFTQRKNESESLTNHVAGVTCIKYSCDVNMILVSITEALFIGGVQTRPLYVYDNPEYEILIMRNKSLTNLDRFHLAQNVKAQVGKPYSFQRIRLQILDKIISKFLPFEFNFFSKFAFSWSTICSVLWAVDYAKFNLFFGVDERMADPDQMLDYCLKSEDWIDIFATDGFFNVELP